MTFWSLVNTVNRLDRWALLYYSQSSASVLFRRLVPQRGTHCMPSDIRAESTSVYVSENCRWKFTCYHAVTTREWAVILIIFWPFQSHTFLIVAKWVYQSVQRHTGLTHPFYSAPVGERSIAISLSVCLSMSVRDYISGSAGPIFTNFFAQIALAVARSSSCGVAICYILPVLWMTSRLAVVGSMAMRWRLNL